MSTSEPSFSIGVEEEYLLVDKSTRDLVADPPPCILRECEELLQGQVSPEFMRAQIEVGTRVCHSVEEARWDLARLRSVIAEVTGRQGLAPIAASTHPYARWLDQKHTERERYDTLSAEMQAAARRLLICGMHVHVGIEDNELRIDLMNQFSYFVPHLLALSFPSPFWEGRLRRAAPHGPAGALRELGGVPAPRGRHDQRRPDRGRDQDLVGPAAQRPLSHPGGPRRRRLHAARRRGHDRGARRLHTADALPAALREPALAHVRADAPHGEPLAGHALQLR